MKNVITIVILLFVMAVAIALLDSQGIVIDWKGFGVAMGALMPIAKALLTLGNDPSGKINDTNPQP